MVAPGQNNDDGPGVLYIGAEIWFGYPQHPGCPVVKCTAVLSAMSSEWRIVSDTGLVTARAAPRP